MDAQTVTIWAQGLALVIGGILAVRENLRRQRAERAAERAEEAKAAAEQEKQKAEDSHKIIEIKDELIKVQKEASDAWKHKWETEHTEYTTYREETHKKLNAANAAQLELTLKIGELQAKTDMSPILDFQKQQSEMNQKMLETLAQIGTAISQSGVTLERLVDKIEAIEGGKV